MESDKRPADTVTRGHLCLCGVESIERVVSRSGFVGFVLWFIVSIIAHLERNVDRKYWWIGIKVARRQIFIDILNFGIHPIE
jgi:hypothetical protein